MLYSNICKYNGRFVVLFFVRLLETNFFFILEDCRVKGNINFGMKRTSSSTHKCSYPGCLRNTNLTRSERLLQYAVLKKFNFFILDDTRVCPNHSSVESWEKVNDDGVLNYFKEDHIKRVVEILRNPEPICERSVCGNHYFQLIIKFLISDSNIFNALFFRN